jgi:hypothetical protein
MLCSEIQPLPRPLQANSTNSPPLPLVSHSTGLTHLYKQQSIVLLSEEYYAIIFKPVKMKVEGRRKHLQDTILRFFNLQLQRQRCSNLQRFSK